MVDFRTALNDLYLDYVNNYLTVEKFAEVQGLSKEDTYMLINLGKKINNKEYSKGD